MSPVHVNDWYRTFVPFNVAARPRVVKPDNYGRWVELLLRIALGRWAYTPAPQQGNSTSVFSVPLPAASRFICSRFFVPLSLIQGRKVIYNSWANDLAAYLKDVRGVFSGLSSVTVIPSVKIRLSWVRLATSLCGGVSRVIAPSRRGSGI
jgi:hypothetical protein